jgi:hypothetical protein
MSEASMKQAAVNILLKPFGYLGMRFWGIA